MKYLCLAYGAEATFTQMPRVEWDALHEETLTYVEAMAKGGDVAKR